MPPAAVGEGAQAHDSSIVGARPDLQCTAVAAWGGSFVAARIVLIAAFAGQAVLTPTVLATVRFGLASVVFLAPLVRAIVRRAVAAGDLLRMGMPGQLMYSVYFCLPYTGLQQTSASVSSIQVVGLVPLATAALSLGR